MFEEKNFTKYGTAKLWRVTDGRTSQLSTAKTALRPTHSVARVKISDAMKMKPL